jgi:hypothetical protein
MRTFKKSLIVTLGTVLLYSCFSNVNDDRKNIVFGTLNTYHHGETYKASDLNEKFIELYNGNLNGKGLNPEYIDSKGNTIDAHPGYTTNIINLVDQFLNPETQPKRGTNLNISQYDVDSYHILYNTPGVNYINDSADFIHRVSGLVLVPKIPANQIKGIVLYYHGTESAKNSVPSCTPNSDFSKASKTNYSYCNVNAENFNQNYTIKLGAVFAAQGYIVFAPDYIGLGNDNHFVHPYVVYPEINALSGIYGLQALKQLLDKEEIIDKSEYKLFIGGYSEGGAYALKTSELLQYKNKDILDKNQLKLVSTAPAEGAYSLSDVQMNFEFDDLTDGLTNVKPEYANYVNQKKDKFIEYLPEKEDPTSIRLTDYQINNNPWHIGSSLMASIAKSYLISYALTSYGYYSLHNLASSYDQLMPRQFWNNISIFNDKNQKIKEVNLVQFYNSTAFTANDVLNIFYHTRTQKHNGQLYNPNEDLTINLFLQGTIAPDTKEAKFPITIKAEKLQAIGTGRNNSAASFVHDNIRNLPLFKKSMENADTFKWNTKSPIYFISCDYDSVVPSKNTEIAYKYMHDNSKDLVNSIKINNFQLTNEMFQYVPSGGEKDTEKLLISKYWAPIPEMILDNVIKQYPDAEMFSSLLAVPIDHTQAEPITLIASLCIFEKGNNLSICK